MTLGTIAGTKGARRRGAVLDGRLEVESPPGTRLSVAIPLARKARGLPCGRIVRSLELHYERGKLVLTGSAVSGRGRVRGREQDVSELSRGSILAETCRRSGRLSERRRIR